ncbi:MAG: hypothetical protein AB7F22_10635 [Reyranella sp.]
MAGVAPGYGPAQPTWADLRAWADLTGETLHPWEARLIVRLGMVRASTLAEVAEAERNKP